MAEPLASAPQDHVTPTQETPDLQNQLQGEPTSYQKSNSVLKIGAGVVLILLLSATAYLGYQNWQLRQQISLGKPTSTPPLSVTPTQGPTENWKTYMNNKAGYSLSYPTSWVLIETEKSTTIEDQTHKNFTYGTFSVSLVDNPKKLTLQQWANDYFIPLVADPKVNLAKFLSDVSVDNVQAKKFTVFRFDSSKAQIFVMRNDSLYLLEFDEENPNDPDFDKNQKNYNQILSTFKFLGVKKSEEQIPWVEAKDHIKNCNVTSVSQAHNLTITLTLKSGVHVETVEPEIDDVFDEIRLAEKNCGAVISSTE